MPKAKGKKPAVFKAMKNVPMGRSMPKKTKKMMAYRKK